MHYKPPIHYKKNYGVEGDEYINENLYGLCINVHVARNNPKYIATLFIVRWLIMAQQCELPDHSYLFFVCTRMLSVFLLDIDLFCNFC